jgi:hypothetical protein
MAHSALHFAVGMAAGAACAAAPLARAWRAGLPVARPYIRWFAASVVGGTIAVAPSLLRRLGVPETVCESAWMNVFLLHPLIDRVKPGGITMGPLLMGAAFAAQYTVLLLAVFRARRAAKQEDGEGGASLPRI